MYLMAISHESAKFYLFDTFEFLLPTTVECPYPKIAKALVEKHLDFLREGEFFFLVSFLVLVENLLIAIKNLVSLSRKQIAIQSNCRNSAVSFHIFNLSLRAQISFSFFSFRKQHFKVLICDSPRLCINKK